MTINDRWTLKIESVAFGGSGVGRAEGLVVFIPFAAPGDIAEIEIVQRRKKFARGRLLNILSPSPQRTTPLCGYYGLCGGCAYQHIDYVSQLAIKQKQTQDAFIRIGGLADPEVLDIIGSPRAYAYRGKARLHVRKQAGVFQIGFLDISGGNLLDIERCEIMEETINEQLRLIKAGKLGLGGEDSLILWSQYPDYSAKTIARRVKEREFLVPFAGFFQTNLFLIDCLVDTVCDIVNQKTCKTICDAYCGCGLFSIFLAPYAQRIIGVEISEVSVQYARLNATRLGVTNTKFIAGSVEQVLQDMAGRKEQVDLLLLDPPRSGLSQATLAAIVCVRPEEIIYISCNPATQARDIGFLTGQGYRLLGIQPLDMFAQTEHLEIIARLQCV